MSLTPDHFRKVGTGVSPSPSPFFTPRPERRRPDSRGSEWNSNRQDKDKEVNVQVLLRCRPLSDDEQRANVPKVVTCNETKREVTVLQGLANKQVDRVFTFDKVFGPKAQQRSIYDQAISPIVCEMLEGFNCTVFAYGQTGTGKTYTMEGGMRKKGGELPAEAGVIPRAVRQIFDTLDAQDADYNMKVTFLELYNEEITDLLGPEDNSKSTEDRQKKPISLMEDGKGCVVVRGLEEEAVYSANDIYNLLERGAARRRTADTLLNKRSSRSHSVFTITVHIKEKGVGDEDLIKCGKLNLVDLAGSENISRSGARELRAREAGEINKSLLTLGRVINTLVEHSLHIPYRDSKLTRLLRDSLGGKTKTCIIATISPSVQSLEETLSTLDYACRAKNIKNKPEANQRVSKAMLLKDIYLEMEKMKQDIRAAREKNGVYIPHERFLQDEAEKKAKTERIELLKIDLDNSEKQLHKFHELYLSEQEDKLNVESELKDCKENLQNTYKILQELQENYKTATSALKEKESTISKLQHSEIRLTDCAKDLRANLQGACKDINDLFEKIDHKDKIEVENQSLLLTFGAQLDRSLKLLHEIVVGSIFEQQQQLRSFEEHATSFLDSKCDSTQAMESRIKKLTKTYDSGILALNKLSDILQLKASSDLRQMKSMISSQATTVENFLKTASLEAKDFISDIQNSLAEQRQLLGFSAQKQQEGLRRSVVSAQVISNATITFFNDLHRQASQLMKVLEESQIVKSHQLQNFEQMFKEEAIREEKSAMEKIAAILASLTARKTAIVSEASKSFEDSCIQENKRVMQGLTDMQQVSTKAEKELNEYIEKAKNHYLEDTFSSAECIATIENCLLDNAKRVDCCGQQWDNAQLGINHVSKNNLAEIETNVRTKILENHSIHDELVSTSSSMNTEFHKHIHDLNMSTHDSLMFDKESTKQIDLMTKISLDQLKSTSVNHGKSVSDICNRTEQCLSKDYLVDKHTNRTPKKRAIPVPSLESIEEMRAHIVEVHSEAISKCSNAESKIMQPYLGASMNRTPFQNVN
ncbi:kinesin KIN-5B [Olea europaea subsp. europaea]|uniref:Kinesin KIN-5B n=1 Tax=Olea europaea subsp. europaea TaxID=158383 RepID=A0A8S0TD63_OLEEU|nr:kinesin KIN-5B [Olea europaea subsp. europaea]